MEARILVIEDDRELARLLQLDLTHAGYQVQVAETGLDGLLVFQALRPHLVVLDIGLPLMDGITVCQRLREISDVPILLMTAQEVTEEDIAAGLNLGADEFLLKPLRPLEFQARVKALLRRARALELEANQVARYEDDYLVVDLTTRQVMVAGQEVRLTPTEFKLLAVFVNNPGKVLTFRQLLEQVWGYEYATEHHYPRIYVSHLRRKIEPDVKEPTYIHSEYGVGYRFVGRAAE